MMTPRGFLRPALNSPPATPEQADKVRIHCNLPRGSKGEVIFRPKREKFLLTLVLTTLKRGGKGLLAGS